jgi:hypothetical protein
MTPAGLANRIHGIFAVRRFMLKAGRSLVRFDGPAEDGRYKLCTAFWLTPMPVDAAYAVAVADELRRLGWREVER